MFLPFPLTKMCVCALVSVHAYLCECVYIEIETSLGCLVWVISSFCLRLLALVARMCFENIKLACCMMTRQYTCTHTHMRACITLMHTDYVHPGIV